MTDKRVQADILAIAMRLPNGSAVIYRHFGAPDKERIADDLRQLSFARNIQFLVGQDEDLARQCGADGLHLPERNIDLAKRLKSRYPDWIITGAAHNQKAIKQCQEYDLNACFISPLFPTKSEGSGAALGLERFASLASLYEIPVFALGGINANNAHRLLATKVAGLAAISAFLEC